MDELIESGTGLHVKLDGKRDTRHAYSVSVVQYIIKNYLYDILGADPVPEPALRDYVIQYFKAVKARISQDRSRKILEAVKMMEFASLRGEGRDKRCKDKQVLLIEERQDRLPHYIATDRADSNLWSDFQRLLGRGRLPELRRLRNQIGRRIVEVPKRWSLEEPDPRTGFVYVPEEIARQAYSTETGWSRPL